MPIMSYLLGFGGKHSKKHTIIPEPPWTLAKKKNVFKLVFTSYFFPPVTALLHDDVLGIYVKSTK